MITKNKLSGQSSTRLKSDFTLNTKKSHKKNPFLWLPVLLILVAGGTFAAAYFLLPRDLDTSVSEDQNANLDLDDATASGNEGTEDVVMDDGTASVQPITQAKSTNPTVQYGRLMLINPNYTVEPSFIAERKQDLISLTTTYGILELHAYNGDNLLDPEAAEHLSKMLADYTVANPGHFIQTVSCFREVGTSCGRLCMPTGASDHHTGLTCDLIDPVYGDSLDTDEYEKHIEWQWLKANSYKYGFIDRFPEAWAGGPMSAPMNVDAEGSTGLYETWHYRYVGEYAAEEIATGLYNNGEYDSLEHYLLARSLLTDLLNRQM